MFSYLYMGSNIYYLIFAMIILYLLVISYSTIVHTASTAANNTANITTSMFNKVSYGLISGPVFNFN
jgi:hypothetical protein